MILPATAERNSGMCIPCKDGKREQIEEAKKRYAQEKQYDPYRALWHSLVMRVHKTEQGFAGLTDDERLYFAIGMLEGEVYSGGFDQFFWNSSGNIFAEAAAGLKRLGAPASADLLEQARRILFGQLQPPSNWEERRALLR